ncbi:MAG: hypothetical protein K0M67_11890 [Thiobacillus sp.]|nr:hypothetical protein [Hydrogenophaga sp.]MBW8468956.1 hypothetical protein [Thiobacillus sp.]
MTTTYERLQAILIKDYRLAPEVLVFDAPLASLGIDSLATAELLFYVEDEFAITLPPQAIELTTLGDVVVFIDGLIEKQGKSKLELATLSDSAAPAAT